MKKKTKRWEHPCWWDTCPWSHAMTPPRDYDSTEEGRDQP